MAEENGYRARILELIVDYYCSVFWEEFKQEKRVDILSEKKFVNGLLAYARKDIPQWSERATFLHLLCHLSEASQVDETPTPLEKALVCLDQLLEQYQEISGTLEVQVPVDWDVLRNCIKIQTVLALLREGHLNRAKKMTDKMWPRSLRSDEGEELMIGLQEMCKEGKVTLEIAKTHSLEKFYNKVILSLEELHASFGKPFLSQIAVKMQECKRNDEHKKTVISHAALKMASGADWTSIVRVTNKLAEVHASSSGTEANPTTATKRKQEVGASTADEASPQKRGRSIRDVKYAKKRRAGVASPGETAIWDESEGEAETSFELRGIDHTDLLSPRVRRSLSASNKRHGCKPVKRRPWSDDEVDSLLRGVKRYGTGKWAEILLAFDFDDRTSVQLKDKWRNLVKNESI